MTGEGRKTQNSETNSTHQSGAPLGDGPRVRGLGDCGTERVRLKKGKGNGKKERARGQSPRTKVAASARDRSLARKSPREKKRKPLQNLGATPAWTGAGRDLGKEKLEKGLEKKGDLVKRGEREEGHSNGAGRDKLKEEFLIRGTRIPEGINGKGKSRGALKKGFLKS